MDNKALVGQQASPMSIPKASTRNAEEAEEFRQTSPSQSWSTMGSWRPGSKSSQTSSGFSYGLSDSGFLDTPRPRSARGLEPTLEESSQSAQPLADSGFFETPLALHSSLRPASRSSRLPSLKEINATDGGTMRGSVMSTITGSVIAALSALPLVRTPRFPTIPTQERDAVAQFADALASVCITIDELAHAVVIVEDGDLTTLYHAEDASPDDTQDGAVQLGLVESRRHALGERLGNVWEHLRDLHSQPSSAASIDVTQTELIRLLFPQSLPALQTRFKRHSLAALTHLDNILRRSVPHEQILRHPQPWRFNCLISETEWQLVATTHKLLSSVEQFFVSFAHDPSHAVDTDALDALHRNLLALYLAWFNPETRKNNENKSYFLHHLDRLLQLPFAQYLRDIVWLAKAIHHLILSANSPAVSSVFSKPSQVVFIDNQTQPFLANLDHDEVVDRISNLYMDEAPTLDLAERRKRDWSAFVLEPLRDHFNDGDHRIFAHADTHCECSLLALIDRKRPQGLLRYVGLSHDSCLACWEQFAAYNAFMDNLPRKRGEVPACDTFFSPWRPIHTRTTDTRIQSPWVPPEMPSDRRGFVSLYTQTALLSDLDTAYNRKRQSMRATIPLTEETDDDLGPDVDLNDLFPTGDEKYLLFTRV
ncbi:hypothetical protein AURDEDRAFT_110316 [Auricularia subglabra TFB-10046 SS5]|nr:hypothetical protein AURDEDRAFT_110316 [Auricularia subglabra TFB-10046 SS5]